MSQRTGCWTRKLGSQGPELKVEVGRVARLVDGAVLLTAGRAVLLVTAVSRSDAGEGMGFFPLTVEYREKMAATRRIWRLGPASRRPGRPAFPLSSF